MSHDNSLPVPELNASHEADVARALKILVVEDNNDFRETLCEMLQMLGHTVIDEATGDEALHALGQNNIDLLITDVTLPGMSGLELAKRVHDTLPHVRIILSSGYKLSTGSHFNFQVAILSKPYSLNQLTECLQEVMKS